MAYIYLANIKFDELSTLDKDILQEVLGNFIVSKTNGIYVCTMAYYNAWDVCYEETNHYIEYVPNNSSEALKRVYQDIENGKGVSCYLKKERPKDILCSDFEKENIVLNPYNTWKNKNGYQEVREDFFDYAINMVKIRLKNYIIS